MSNYSHAMVDIETMGNGFNSSILSIGAVPFDPKVGLASSEVWFYERITLESNLANHRNMSADTIEWWLAQSKEAQTELLREPRWELPIALKGLNKWITSHRIAVIWSKPPQMDVLTLSRAYEDCKIPCPFRYFRDARDLRTLIDVADSMGWQDVADLERLGNKHSAIDDAAHQARQVVQFFSHLP